MFLLQILYFLCEERKYHAQIGVDLESLRIFRNYKILLRLILSSNEMSWKWYK